MESSWSQPPYEYSTSVFWCCLEVEAGECPTCLAWRVLVPSQWNGVGANDVSVEHGQQCRPAVPWFRYRLLCQRRRSRQHVFRGRRSSLNQTSAGTQAGRAASTSDAERRRRLEQRSVMRLARPTWNSYEVRNNGQTYILHARNGTVTK